MRTTSGTIIRAGLIATILALGFSAGSSAATVAVTTNNAGSVTSAGAFSLGWRFSVTNPIDVTSLGRFDRNGGGLAANALARLYNWDTGAALGSTTILSSSVGESAGFYNAHYANLGSTVSLSPGINYLVAVEVSDADYAFDVNATLASGINFIEGRATPVGSPAMPAAATTSSFSIARSSAGGMSYLGPNFKFESAGGGSPTLSLSDPTGRAVFQRDAQNEADIAIEGTFSGSATQIEARAVARPGFGGTDTPWQIIDAAPTGGAFSGTLNVQGGWYDIEVRSLDGVTQQAQASVQRVGVGEVFITAGQSNSANHGSPQQTANDDRVSAYNLSTGMWQHAVDPQPGASGSGGSPWPQLGDLLAAELGVPVGFISVGQGSTTVAQWLPGTANYDNRLEDALSLLGSDGLRAVLWHQGESDSIAGTSSANYATRLNAIIAQSRIDAGFDVPWGIALASYHPSSSAANEAQVIAGQELVINGTPLVFEGAFTDDFHTLGYLTDTVHFNQQGLDEHALRWFTQIDSTFFSSSAVPEPSTWALATLSLVGLGFVALRTKYRRV